jgi:glycogen synthase
VKILHITPLFDPELGGIETFTSRLVAGLAACGHRMCVVSSHGALSLPDESSHGAVPVHRLPLFAALAERDPRGLLEAKRRMTAIKRAFAPDVVHVHVGGPIAVLHLWTEAESPAPLVVTVYDLPPAGMESPTILEVLARAKRVAAISDARLRDLQRMLPTVSSRVTRIYPRMPAADPLAGEGVVKAEHPVLFVAGRLVPEKGFDVAVGAFARIHERRRGARLVIAGDGPMRVALRDEIRWRGLEASILLTGRLPRDELVAWYRRAWVTLMPSRHSESFGLVALEAMQAACPVVASRVGGLEEVVVDGETGTLVPPDDEEALSRAVEALLADEGLRRRMGASGRRRARSVFDWHEGLEAYERLYEEATRP